MERETLFVDVIIPLAVPELYTYRIPSELNDEVEVGKRAIVQFGKKRLYTAIICEIKHEPNPHYQAKYIDLIIDESPIVTPAMIRFWKWIASYYMCNIGDVMNAALPSNLKFSSQTILLADKELTEPLDDLSRDELMVLQLIRESEGISLQELATSRQVPAIVKRLIDRGLVFTAEEIKDSFKPKKEIVISLSPDYSGEEGLQKAMDLIVKYEKQLDVLLAFVELSNSDQQGTRKVLRKNITKRISRPASALQPLIKKGIFIQEEIEVDRIHSFSDKTQKLPLLVGEQKEALQLIKTASEKKNVTLLEGVTSSGKTLVYAHLIKETIDRGEQVLYVLPEIGLTQHLISRLKVYFGSSLGVYHSKFKKDERVEIWNKVLNNDEKGGRVIVGARSSIFLPFKKLGLVIIDEEHDSSLKQYQPAPRYHARDAAIMLANLSKCKIILGSATPSLESRYQAKEGKYNWVRLTKRFGDIQLPEILIHDIRQSKQEKWKADIFSKLLLDLTRYDFEKGHQVIYFQNRRGFSPLWLCKICGWVPRCDDCDVNLTYHKHNHQLSCHYCGKNYSPPIKCQACGSSKLSMPGYGTERIEDEIASFFPKQKIARLDLDTTRTKNAYENILDRFENKEIDLLVGTQMLSKGLDFNNVQLVGILSADQMLNFPDFRAYERSFQMMVQVAGRSGRLKKRGKVIIQTRYPDNWVLEKVKNHDYDAFYNKEIVERRQFKYPPFYRLIRVIIIDKNKGIVEKAAEHLADRLKASLNERILGPEFPYISRIRNKFHIHVLVKMERSLSTQKVRGFLQSEIDYLLSIKTYRSIRVNVDVDPI